MSLPLAFPQFLNQTATYWAPGGPDGFGGVLFTTPPVLIKCRWQNAQKLFRQTDGEEHVSNAVIWPDTELVEKGYVALGDFTATADPRTLTGVAWEIRQCNWSPSLRADRQMNKAYV